jgi:hypothetical protein
VQRLLNLEDRLQPRVAHVGLNQVAARLGVGGQPKCRLGAPSAQHHLVPVEDRPPQRARGQLDAGAGNRPAGRGSIDLAHQRTDTHLVVGPVLHAVGVEQALVVRRALAGQLGGRAPAHAPLGAHRTEQPVRNHHVGRSAGRSPVVDLPNAARVAAPTRHHRVALVERQRQLGERRAAEHIGRPDHHLLGARLDRQHRTGNTDDEVDAGAGWTRDAQIIGAGVEARLILAQAQRHRALGEQVLGAVEAQRELGLLAQAVALGRETPPLLVVEA